MSCVIVPAAPADSILDVKIVNSIQTALSSLSWLDAVYGIAEVSEMKNSDGSIEKFPRVYSNLSTREYTDVRYDDSLKAQIFFERDGEIQFGQTDEMDEVTYPLALVCWANLNKVDAGRNYDFTEMLAGDVLRILKDNFDGNIGYAKQVELRSEFAYSKYTMSDVVNRFITLPYTAFRISFTYTEFQSGTCNEFIPIGGTPC